MAKKIAINALHTKTGGGLVFFNHIVPLLAQDSELELTAIAHKDYADRLNVPNGVKLHVVDFEGGFFKTLVWEQFKLPALIRSLGCDATFNLANYCALFAPKNVLFVTNNPEVRHYTKSKGQKVYWHALIWMTRLSLAVCAKAISNGNYMKQVYASGFFKPLQKKMVKATTACDYELHGKVEKKPNQLIAIGDFYRHKNYPVLLQALDMVRKDVEDVHLLVVGRPVDGHVDAQVQCLMEDLELSKNVTFLGALPHAETQQHLAESEIYVSPSDAEAFSLTLLEAMTVGTASVVKDHDFQKEVAQEVGAEYVAHHPNHDVQAERLAGAILDVLQNDVHRGRLVEEGLKLSKETSWASSAQIIANVLRSV